MCPKADENSVFYSLLAVKILGHQMCLTDLKQLSTH